MYSFSTCWNSHRHTDGRAMLREIRALGFDYAELSHGTRVSLMPGILDAVEAGEMKISSLHNFCPLPMGVNHSAPNLYQFSDERPRERELALKHTAKTIEFAARVKASVVVLHVGSVEIKNYTEKLLNMAANGESRKPDYKKLCTELVVRREAKKKAFWHRTLDMLKKIVPAAVEHGIVLGVENRQALEELPIESDYPSLFKEIPSGNLLYWHDTGHAQIKENLGFIKHAEHLESLTDHLAGFHLHDVAFPGHDHRPPGTGTVNFAALKPFVKEQHIKVFEFSPKLSTQEAKDGVAYLKKLWGS
jgi:sugar phosphate isomerase/epimerase